MTPEPGLGDTVGRWRLEELIGEGGMGRVYRAVDSNGQVAAMKIVKAELASDKVFRKRFDREAKVAQRVDHPHVVPVIETGELDGIPYLVQVFITGGSLEDRIKREHKLPLDETVRICTAVASGLDALHGEGLIHRDVKPANILLDDQGTPYIADFGLAKDRDASILTKAGQALGSMDYMSPEQIRGEDVSAQSDVYALGCVMFECLSGRPPFADKQGMRILWAHLQEEPPDPLAERDDVPPDVGWALRQALAKEPDGRPPTATAYAGMVRIAAGGRAG
ncbi:MAG TPA: serine/threonine-protein kinase [Solirubrobacteraceae bacterium]|nr:serine/threonine-protein kinase [Solirubrobacteraceae bacterium]